MILLFYETLKTGRLRYRMQGCATLPVSLKFLSLCFCHVVSGSTRQELGHCIRSGVVLSSKTLSAGQRDRQSLELAPGDFAFGMFLVLHQCKCQNAGQEGQKVAASNDEAILDGHPQKGNEAECPACQWDADLKRLDFIVVQRWGFVTSDFLLDR